MFAFTHWGILFAKRRERERERGNLRAMSSVKFLHLVVLLFVFLLQASSSQKKKGKYIPGPPNRPETEEELTCKVRYRLEFTHTHTHTHTHTCFTCLADDLTIFYFCFVQLTDKSSGAIFNLNPLFKLNDGRRKFFVINGASGGPFDHVDMEYDYHFSLCGVTPPTPFECQMGNSGIFRAPAYQVVKKKDKTKGRQEAQATSKQQGKSNTLSFDGDMDKVIRNCYAIGSGDRGSWTFSLINKDDPSVGVQLDYKDGQECFKRVVERRKTETGREKREVKWVPTPRSTTIKMTCNPYSKDLDQSGENKMKGNIERVVGRTQSIHAVEDEMCHYTLTWESPYGCPTNKKIRSVEDRRGEEVLFTEDASGVHKRTRRTMKRGKFLQSVWNLFMFIFLSVSVVVGIQVFRHWKWMKIVIPQTMDTNPIQKKLARKKFVKLIMTFGEAKQLAPGGSRLV